MHVSTTMTAFLEKYHTDAVSYFAQTFAHKTAHALKDGVGYEYDPVRSCETLRTRLHHELPAGFSREDEDVSEMAGELIITLAPLVHRCFEFLSGIGKVPISRFGQMNAQDLILRSVHFFPRTIEQMLVHAGPVVCVANDLAFFLRESATGLKIFGGKEGGEKKWTFALPPKDTLLILPGMAIARHTEARIPAQPYLYKATEKTEVSGNYLHFLEIPCPPCPV